MPTYVALLRGINVGGHAKLAMSDLRALMADLGHEGVRTHLQSGNAIFDSPSDDPAALGRAIAERIRRDLGLSIAVLVRSAADLGRVVAANPYAGQGIEETSLYVTFLAERPDRARARDLVVPAGETAEFTIRDREVFLHYPDGYGRTKLSNAYLEKRLAVAATTRTWRVVVKLSELAGG